jgi:hypothetical protein
MKSGTPSEKKGHYAECAVQEASALSHEEQCLKCGFKCIEGSV